MVAVFHRFFTWLGNKRTSLSTSHKAYSLRCHFFPLQIITLFVSAEKTLDLCLTNGWSERHHTHRAKMQTELIIVV